MVSASQSILQPTPGTRVAAEWLGAMLSGLSYKKCFMNVQQRHMNLSDNAISGHLFRLVRLRGAFERLHYLMALYKCFDTLDA